MELSDLTGLDEYEVKSARPRLAIFFRLWAPPPFQLLAVQDTWLGISIVNLLVDGYKIIRPHEVNQLSQGFATWGGWGTSWTLWLFCTRYVQVRILAITRASGAFEIAGTRQGISQGRIVSRGPTPENTHPARFSTLDSGAEGGTSPWR